MPTGRKTIAEVIATMPPEHQELHRRGGLGDVVAAIAMPIARAIDRISGTDLEHCGGCNRRREALNKAVPFR